MAITTPFNAAAAAYGWCNATNAGYAWPYATTCANT